MQLAQLLQRYCFFGCLAFAALQSIGLNALAQQIEPEPAPNFTLPTHGGEKGVANMQLEELLGEVVLLNFWASWCGPCRQEMPLLDELAKKYAQLGVTVLGVNVESDTAKALEFLEKTPVSFPILLDKENVVSKLYDVKAMPTTFLIDRDGNIRAVHRGYKPGYEEQYEADIKTLAREL